MKIELEHPYKSDWRFGYLVTNKENRATLILYNSKLSRSSTQYARYLLSVHLGRYLLATEQVDHIDGDKTNNRLSNLQLLSALENHHKTFLTGETLVENICVICGEKFFLTARKSHRGQLCCSRKCGWIKGSNTKRNKIKEQSEGR